MFMSFFNVFEKIKFLILRIKTGTLIEGPYMSFLGHFQVFGQYFRR